MNLYGVQAALAPPSSGPPEQVASSTVAKNQR